MTSAENKEVQGRMRKIKQENLLKCEKKLQFQDTDSNSKDSNCLWNNDDKMDLTQKQRKEHKKETKNDVNKRSRKERMRR